MEMRDNSFLFGDSQMSHNACPGQACDDWGTLLKGGSFSFSLFLVSASASREAVIWLLLIVEKPVHAAELL